MQEPPLFIFHVDKEDLRRLQCILRSETHRFSPPTGAIILLDVCSSHYLFSACSEVRQRIFENIRAPSETLQTTTAT